MNHKLSFIILLSVCFLSCDKRFKDAEEMAQVAILGGSMFGNPISSTYEISRQTWDTERNIINFDIVSQTFQKEPEKGAEIDALYESVVNGELEQNASPEEAFAYERIEERTRELKDQYALYLEQLAEAEGIDLRALKLIHAGFIYAYFQGVPTITADGDFFGQPAGTDLSEWFRFRDGNLIDVIGQGYKMEKKGDRHEYQEVAEYFTKDKMSPMVIKLGITALPDDLSYTGRVVGDDIVHVNISIPVRIERYWEWCKALYSNPEATETITDTSLRLTIPFVRNKQ